jgi:hypothetical protein
MNLRLQPLDRTQPVVRGVRVCLAFVGLYWLTEPVFAYLGFNGIEPSRPHLLFVGACVAIGLTVLLHWRRRHGSQPVV